MDGYRRGGHSKYSLKVHLIFVTKYRKKLFQSGRRADDVKQYLYDAAKKQGYTILQMETDKDHVYILLEYSPKVSVSEIVKQLKQDSTHQMWSAITATTYPGGIGNTGHYGPMGILPASLVRCRKRQSNNTFKTRVDWHGTPCIHTPKGMWFYG